MSKIQNIFAREILNSKALPTVEASVVLDNGIIASASSPTGTSIGKYEAKEIRDNDPERFGGLGVLKAIENITSIIAPKLIGLEADRQHDIDKILIELDGTSDKSRLGTNSILPVSMGAAKAAAKTMNIPLFAYLRRYTNIQNAPFKIPTPAFNIINGGKHAGNNLDFQEFIIIPASSVPFPDTINMAVSIYQSLKKTLQEKNSSTLVGDEGGFGPSLTNNRDGLVILNEALGEGKYRLNYDVFFGIDAAAENFYKNGKYLIKDKESGLESADLVTVYEGINEEFNLLYLEDPLAEDDWDGWEKINAITSRNTLIVGDDLIATNLMRLQKAISKKAVSAVILKPNQIGTVMETIAVAEVARNAGLKLVASHRSGETNDDFIADFAVAVGADYVKFGAPARGERVAKYNRLLEIYSQIKSSSG